jgi:long-chain acyl-CoA synthetase
MVRAERLELSTAMNVASLADDAFERNGDYPALWFEGRWHTSGEMHGTTHAVAGGLLALGVQPGDRVVFTMLNCPEVGIGYNAAWRAGAAVVPVLFLLTAGELAHILTDSAAVAVVTTPELLPKVQEAVAQAPSVQHVICVGGEAADRVVDFATLATAEPMAQPHDAAPDDVAVILYTSGTTGHPKGVLLSHHNLVSMARNAHAATDLGEGNIGLAALPLSHSYGISTTLASTFRKGTGVMLRWFDAGESLRLIEEQHVAVTALVPTMMVYMLEHPDATTRDTSSLRYVISGGAALPAEVQREFEARFGCTVLQGYGLSESSAQCSIMPLDAPRPGSVGKPVPGVEVCIVDEQDDEVARGEIGEIVMRGPNMMLGYRNMPEETAAVMRGGWLHSGDMGRVDDDGYLYVVDRKKDLIIRGGFNILPRDVEEVLHEHPAVAQAAVIGVPDRRMGEEVRAYVVLKSGATATPDELMAFSRDRLAAYKTPSSVELLPSLPVNAIGKVLRRALRDAVTSK